MDINEELALLRNSNSWLTLVMLEIGRTVGHEGKLSELAATVKARQEELAKLRAQVATPPKP